MRDATQLQARLQSQLKSFSPGISSTSKNSRKGNQQSSSSKTKKEKKKNH